MNKKLLTIIIIAGLIGGFFGSIATSHFAQADLLDNIWSFIKGSSLNNATSTASVKTAAPYAPTIDYEQAVVKAQIHSGGRGKAGGIKLVKSRTECVAAAKELIGKTLVTKQTGTQGRKVRKLLIEAAVKAERELYFALLVDRSKGRAVAIVSEAGGMEIETVAMETPEKIVKETVDPALGLMPFQSRKLATRLNLHTEAAASGARLIQAAYRLFVECDASLVEINPLIVTTGADGKETVLALDGKINFDDNALPRHPDIIALRDMDEEDPREVEASKFNLNYIGLDGNIGCMVNGAGLAMATMDIIKFYGGAPANFLDVGGGADTERVTEAFKILCSDARAKAILVNIFGGIVKCDVIATGIVTAARTVAPRVPLIVRLEGTNVELGEKILQESGLEIVTASGMAEAAKKAIAAVVGQRK